MRVEVRSGVLPEEAPLTEVMESYLLCPTNDLSYLWVGINGENYYVFVSSISTDEVVYRCVHRGYQVYLCVS
jgi:hypothetical protein